MTAHGRRAGRRDDRGQATVEVALMLPVLVILAMALVQVGLVARTTVLVHHAAREGARAAAVGGSGPLYTPAAAVRRLPFAPGGRRVL